MKINLYCLWVVIMVMAVSVSKTMAATLIIDDDFAPPWNSIQHGINTAGPDDQIQVESGTYNEILNFIGKGIRVFSSSGPEVTTIDAAGLNYSVVTCANSEDSDTILEGFTITGGIGTSDGSSLNGGGIRIDGSSPTVINCVFAGNTADYGGGMFNLAGQPTVIECTFSNNTAYQSGGGMCDDDSGCEVVNCTFTGNIAQQYGGGMYNVNGSSSAVINCTFTDNTVESYGGGMCNNSSSPTVTNCLFTRNFSNTGKGGGIANYSGSSATMTNCTIYNNKALGADGGYGVGGGIRNWSSNPTVTNCIIWGNWPEDVSLEGSATVFTYCDIDGGTGQAWFGNGCVDADPLFFNTAGGDFRLISSGSPCVDTGSNDAVTEPNDLAGNIRVFDGNWDGTATVDIGAYELQFREVHNLTQDIWYGVIQIAIDDAVNDDQIEVSPGTYTEAIDFSGKSVELFSAAGPGATTIDAAGLGASVVTCSNGEGLDTVLRGFTLTGGVGTISSGHQYGGGMFNSGSSPTVTECIFTNNSVTGDGGGMYNTDSSPAVTDCTFEQNHADYAGGGMDNRYQSSPTITDCNFIGNTAGTYGAGMENFDNSSPAVTGCDFIGNVADQYGGAMRNYNNSNPVVTDCAFTGNRTEVYYDGGAVSNNTCAPAFIRCNFESNIAIRHAGAMFNNNSSPEVTECVFTTNSAMDDGGGMYNIISSPTVIGCTFNSNTAMDNGGGMYNVSSSNPSVSDCLFVYNLVSGEGGGFFNNNSSPTVTDCSFTGNRATFYGGGMCNYNISSPKVVNCWFSGNYGAYGGGMHNRDSSKPVVTNCVFTQNDATTGSGGGISNYDGSHSIVTNCTFYDNAADDWGGGIRNYKSTPTVANCILWSNTPEQVSHDSSSTVYAYCDIAGGTGQSWFGSGCLDVDPNFVDPNNSGISLVDLRLLPISACIDAADTTAVTGGVLVDLDGNPRGADDPATANTGISYLGKITDMGAYELDPCLIEGDINCDGKVDLIDLCMFSANWLQGVEE